MMRYIRPQLRRIVWFAAILIIAIFVYANQNGQMFGCRGSAACFAGKVDRVIDGDTLVISNVTIRLALVNVPGKNEKAGMEALNFTANLCRVGSTALVDEDDGQRDGSYGRTVAVVYCGKKNVNEALLSNGFGSMYIDFCRRSEFRNEDWAKRNGC